MEKLFLKLIDFASIVGNIVEANLYKGGKYASFHFEAEDGKYLVTVSISKKDEEKENAL
jgi:hypothetical protein